MKWTEEEIQILRDNYTKSSKKEISKLLPNRNYSTIIKQAAYRQISKKREFYSCDLKYFSVPNINNNYWAAFIGADGYLAKNRYQLSIGISNKDKTLLENLKQNLKITNPIWDKYKKCFNKTFHHIRLDWNVNNDYYKDLNKYWNITSCKSLTLEPPNITNSEQQLSYIIGYLDGDGCISLLKRRNTKQFLSFNIVGTKELLIWISEILYNFENKTKYKKPLQIGKKYKNVNCYSIAAEHQRAYKILKLLEEIKTPFKLPRKWNKIKEYEGYNENSFNI